MVSLASCHHTRTAQVIGFVAQFMKLNAIQQLCIVEVYLIVNSGMYFMTALH